MVVFLWCGCGGVLVVVFLWRCFCGGVLVVVFLWWCTKYYSSTTKYYSSTTKYYSSTTPYYKVLLQYYSVLQSTTPYYKVLLQYYKVLLQYYSNTTKYYSSTTPILLCTTKYYSSTTPYYRVLLRPLKRRQNDVLPVLLRTTPVLQKLPKRAFRARLPQLFTEKASKMIVSCEASSKFHRTSFQNERFARCVRQFSQKKLPKGSFRARLPPNFAEQASKTSVLRDASSKFHRTSFQNERFARCFRQFSQKSFQNDHFVRGFLQISQNSASKTSVSRDASDNFHPKFAFRYSFARSTHRFLREGSSAKSKMCLALQRRAFPNFKMYVSLQRCAQKCTLSIAF